MRKTVTKVDNVAYSRHIDYTVWFTSQEVGCE